MVLIESVHVERFYGTGKHLFSWLPGFPYRLVGIECKTAKRKVAVERFHLANIDVLWPRVGSVDIRELTEKELNAPVMSEYNTLHFDVTIVGSEPIEVGFRYVRPEIEGIEVPAFRGQFDWMKPVVPLEGERKHCQLGVCDFPEGSCVCPCDSCDEAKELYRKTKTSIRKEGD